MINLQTGESSETVELKTEVFGVPVRQDLLHQMVVWHLANARAGLANVCAKRLASFALLCLRMIKLTIFYHILALISRKAVERLLDQQERFCLKKDPVTPVKVQFAPLIALVPVRLMDLIPRTGHLR